MFYKNIAEIYASYRPPYPQELFDLILSKLDSRNGYIDLGCGTGELLFHLSERFKQSFGIDPDEDMLKVASSKLEKLGHTNIQLIKQTAEEYLAHLPQAIFLDLVTAGRSFHWMDQEFVANKVYSYLNDRGIFILLRESDGGIWKRKAPWAQVIHNIIIEKFPDKKPFVPIKGQSNSLEIMKINLKKIPFKSIKDYTIETQQQWNIQMIINLFYSGAGFLEWLGNDKEKFETEADRALLELDRSGKFISSVTFGIICCRK